MMNCTLCHGTGSIPNGTDEMACGRCAGMGEIPTVKESLTTATDASKASDIGIAISPNLTTAPETSTKVDEQNSEPTGTNDDLIPRSTVDAMKKWLDEQNK